MNCERNEMNDTKRAHNQCVIWLAFCVVCCAFWDIMMVGFLVKVVIGWALHAYYKCIDWLIWIEKPCCYCCQLAYTHRLWILNVRMYTYSLYRRHKILSHGNTYFVWNEMFLIGSTMWVSGFQYIKYFTYIFNIIWQHFSE